jgi:ADP-ribose pyrophosphatase
VLAKRRVKRQERGDFSIGAMGMEAEEIVWQGRYITAKRRGRWEYVGRARGIGAAVILAIQDDHVLLVEQWRAPLGRMCLELPAGLVGDETLGEDAATSAARELEEETGWRPAQIDIIGDFASSPGMVCETFTLVRASGLTKVGAGGGVDGEDIIVHRIALSDIAAFVAERRAAGCAIDVKLLLLLAGGICA